MEKFESGIESKAGEHVNRVCHLLPPLTLIHDSRIFGNDSIRAIDKQRELVGGVNKGKKKIPNKTKEKKTAECNFELGKFDECPFKRLK